MESTNSTNEPARTYVDALIIINLILLFALTVVLLGRSIVRDRMTGQLIVQHHARDIAGFVASRTAHHPAPTSTAAYIQPWMTFDYVNQVFGLPPTYLQDALDIQDARYPNVSIAHYAEIIGASEAAVLDEVTVTLRRALTAPTSTVPGNTP
jgi:hypothetical protein